MGLQDMDKNVCVLVVDQRCENNQLLVSLCKNDSEWLSPIGWTGQKKVTLLDCRSRGQLTEIDIPQEYAAALMTGDVLTLSCSELDLEQEIIWDRSNVQMRDTEHSQTGVSAIASNLLSRFKGHKNEAEVMSSEAERRAKDAERAAEAYKAKMEAATAAKEEAHRTALNAAREAENALKMEAERIAEMERAAKAFEEAERLKQDELRRVEEERRAEEERLAEEARRIEAARKREEAARREAERKAALDRYQSALDVTRNEQQNLSSRLNNLKEEAAQLDQNRADTLSKHEAALSGLGKSEKSLQKRSAAYDKLAAKLSGSTSGLEEARAQSDSFLSQRDILAHKLVEQESDYQSAQKAAEAAIAIAAEKRAILEATKEEETLLSTQISQLQKGLEAHSLEVDSLAEKAQQSHKRYTDAECSHSTLAAEVEAFETQMLSLSDKDQSLRHEIEATQQLIEDTQSLVSAHRRAIVHLESGGDIDGIEQAELQSDVFESASPIFGTQEEITNDGWVGRVRRNFARKADAQISIDVDEIELDEGPAQDRVSLREKRPKLPAFMAADAVKSFSLQHQTSLIAIGAVVAGVAIIGGGYAINKSAPQLTAKAEQPTQVASAIAKAPPVKTVPELPKAEKLEYTLGTETQNSENQNPEKTNVAAADIEINTPEISSEIAIEEPAAKVAAVTVKEPKLPIAKADIAAIKAPAKPKAWNRKPRNYPEVTRDIQERLFDLGYYLGEFDGLQNEDTLKAVREFKQLYDLPVNDAFTGQFLSKLKQTQQDQKLQQAEAAKTVEAPQLEFYDYVQPVPVEPVWTDSLPAASPAPVPYEASPPEPAPTQLAIAPIEAAPVIAPAIEDVITPSKVIKNAGASYPANALRRKYYKTAIIVLSYDIGLGGEAENIQVSSNDNKSRYAAAFEQEAITMLEEIKFSPKLINDTPVVDSGLTKRIVFQVE